LVSDRKNAAGTAMAAAGWRRLLSCCCASDKNIKQRRWTAHGAQEDGGDGGG